MTFASKSSVPFGGNRGRCLLSAVAVLVCVGAVGAPQACYEITRVDVDPPESFQVGGSGLNDEGVVVGERSHPDFSSQALTWRDGVAHDLRAQLDPGALRSSAIATNNRGDIMDSF